MVVPNQAARHKKLSLTARGLLLTLLSLPDDTKVTVDTVTDGVEEGRRAVSKAFQQLEAAGYLRRSRHQNAETGLWCTETHVSDLPIDRIPTVGEPEGRTVGDSPKGEKNQEKNLLPDPSAEDGGDELAEASEEEEEAFGDKIDQAAPAGVETGRAAQVLSRLGATDRRLALSTTEVLRLAPLAAAWLAEGHSQLKITAVLTARLPERVDSAAALVSYRLKNQMPAKPKPQPEPAPVIRDHCEVCRAPFPVGRRGTVCRPCREDLDSAATFLAGSDLPVAEVEDPAKLNHRGRALCRAAVAA
ncbi:helix-turn-helix domain-containing protein [Streptomyces sp. NPDC045456]|uniref:helix-turn-helix domain-containing protein n=1 Tax=Streptomyces sp. NPDC045456 TaxID=3155254 RepID=UPI0033FEA81C